MNLKIKKSSIYSLEVLLIVFLLFIFSGGAAHLNALARFGFTFSYPIIALLLLLNHKKILAHLWKEPLLFALVFLAIFSVSWSISPSLTFNHGKGLLRGTLLGAYFGIRFNSKQQLNILCITFAICVALSFLYVVALPGQGIHMSGPHVGLWKGAFTHKNTLGRGMNISSQVFLLSFLSTSQKKAKMIYFSGFFLSASLVILSGSATSSVILVVLLSLVPIYLHLQKLKYKLRVFASIFSLLGILTTVLLAALSIEFVVKALGKTLTFSGRADLWPLLLDHYFSQRPFWGYGYQAFWSQYGYLISSVQKWDITHAHSGFIDLLLSLGLLGLLLYLIVYISSFLKTIKAMNLASEPVDFWPLQLLILILIVDFTIEATILSSSSLVWILFVSIVFSLRLHYKKIKLLR